MGGHGLLPAFSDRHPRAYVVAGMDLARPGDLLLRIFRHLLPLRQPAGRARDRERDSELLRTETHRPTDDAEVEVHVRIELAPDEAFVSVASATYFGSTIFHSMLMKFSVQEISLSGYK
jgi:hypothetical protein